MKLKKEFLMLGFAGMLASCLSNDDPEYNFVIFSDTQSSTRAKALYADQTLDTLSVLGDTKCSLTATTYYEGDSTFSAVYNPNWITISSVANDQVTASWKTEFSINTTGLFRIFQATISDESQDGVGVNRTIQYPFLNIASIDMYTYGACKDGIYTVSEKYSKGTAQTDSLIFTIYDKNWTLETSDINALQLRLEKNGEAQSSVSNAAGTYKVYYVLTYNGTGEERSSTLTLKTESGVVNRIIIKQPTVE
jgi:hypothetical protein